MSISICAPTRIPFPEELIGRGKLYRSPMPRDEREVLRLKTDYQITCIVQLCFTEEFEKYRSRDLTTIYRKMDFRVIYFPIKDFKVPASREETRKLADQLIASLKEGENILVHCVAGNGRTGLLIACLAKMLFSFDGPEALAWVRKVIPRAANKEIQEKFVADFLEPKEIKHPARDLAMQIPTSFQDSSCSITLDPPSASTGKEDPYGWAVRPLPSSHSSADAANCCGNCCTIY